MKILCLGMNAASLYFAARLRDACPDSQVVVRSLTTSRHPDSPHILWSPLKPELAIEDTEVKSELERRCWTATGLEVHRSGHVLARVDRNYGVIASDHLIEIMKQFALARGCRLDEHGAANSGFEADMIVMAESCPSDRDGFGPFAQESRLWSALFDLEADSDNIIESFQTSEHGLFHASVIPLGGGRSQVLVEADKDILAAAGLLNASDFSRSFLSGLFETEFSGKRLGARKSDWRPFVTQRASRWKLDKVVLLANAAYCAHHSIRIGARMHLEDADSLASVLLAQDREQAFDEFCAERGAAADSLLRAARASLAWLEHPSRYIEMPSEQFACSFLTKSMRINHSNLAHWTPELTSRVQALIVRGTDAEGETPPMMAPYRLRNLDFINRVVVSPMCMYSATDGTVNDFHLVHLGSRAIGGAGLIVTEMTDVSPEGRISLHCAGMYSPQHLPAWRRITDFVHANSAAKIAIQLGHAGRKGSLTRSWEGHRSLADGLGWRVLAPSPIPFSEGRPVPMEMTRGDMDRVRQAFVTAAQMSDQAGFDMIELHMAHGYLLSSFISPLTNKREDEYGGSLENRLRFPLEVFGSVRAVWPVDKPICVRISAVDWVDGGTTIEEAIVFSRWFHLAGADIICASTGGITSERRPMVGRLYQATFSDQIRNELKIPTMTVGGVASYGDANTLIAAGRADMCALARGYLNDPYFVRHAAERQDYRGMRWPSQYRGADQMPIRYC